MTVLTELSRVSVILPSLDPDDKILGVAKGLFEEGFSDIIVVNDGSKAEKEPYFEQLAALGCTVLRHPENRGKGAALKTAFRYYLENRAGDGAVTVDGDGQHLPADIAACARAMQKRGEIVLGVRDFDDPAVPPRSKFGNKVTRVILSLTSGVHVTDSQTGLRAFPAAHLPAMLETDGDRFEYETNMLIDCKRKSIPLSEVKISTVYIEDNETSHFRPLVDSYRIYKNLFKFSAASLLSFAVDAIAFFLLSLLSLSIPAATAIARLGSSLFNFACNRRAVFHSKEALAKSLLRYYALAVPIALLSMLFVWLLADSFGPVLRTVIKIPVDALLFLISYRVQRLWVFRK